MVLSEKETLLLKDLMKAEELCIQKYGNGVQSAKDAALSRLCSEIEATESTHLQTLNEISAGNPPQINSAGASSKPDPQPVSSGKAAPSDAFLCNDLLAAEKYASSLYDTSIFEFRDTAARNALNHIQKEEQEHGKKLYDYMTAHAIYG